MSQAVLSIGSNLGDRRAWLDFAVRGIAALPQTQILKKTDPIETDPVAVPDAFQHLKFLNSALLIETQLPPIDLLHALQRIESGAGRVRLIPNGPRTLDIDIILYDDLTLSTNELTLPHPRAKERDFVRIPLESLGIVL